jgi:hypothetical protein
MNEADQSGEQPNVSPEEQKLYDLVMTQAQAIVYNEHGVQAVVEKLKAMRDNPAKAIGHSAAMILRSVKGGLAKANVDVPDDVLFHAGTELVADLTELATAAKVISEDQAAQVGQEAIFEGLKTYGEVDIATGELTPEGKKKAQQELDGAKQLEPVAAAMRAGMPEQQGGMLQQQGA